MRKFILKILFFISPFILLAFPIDLFISRNLAKSNNEINGEILIWNKIYNGQMNSDLFVYGASRAWRHFDSQQLEDSFKLTTYNIGIDGQNFWLEYLRHKELIKHNKSPKYIIFSLDIFTLQKGKDLYNYEQFLPFMLLNKDIKDYTDSYNGYNYWDYNIPLLRYYGEYRPMKTALNCFYNREKTGPKRIKGYQGQNFEWTNDFEEAKTSYNHIEIKVDPDSKKLFDEFLTECKNKNIAIVLVYSPEYFEGQQLFTNRNDILGIYQTFADKHHISFLDYSKDDMCRDKKYFYNSQHLNKRGAELFTAKLINDLKKLNFIHPWVRK